MSFCPERAYEIAILVLFQEYDTDSISLSRVVFDMQIFQTQYE